MKIYIPPQVKRLLFFLLIFITMFILLRKLLIPETFGELGHYRAASLLDNEAHEIVFAGQESCLECHGDIGDLIEFDLHSEMNCETCHNAGYIHSQSPEPANIQIPSGRIFCGTCHSQNAARPDQVITQIDLKVHNTDINCIDCHNPHQPWELNE